jgi:uncharacterized protein GlcG (DUF336 family)
MKSTRAGVVRLVCAVLLSLFAVGHMSLPSDAAKPTQKQAMAACKAKYGKKVVNAIINKNGSLTCQWRVVREMTRAEAYESCRKKFGPTTIFVRKKKSGWECRYKPRTSF